MRNHPNRIFQWDAVDASPDLEDQYLLNCKVAKLQKIPVLSQLNALVRCNVVNLSLDAFSTARRVTNAFGGRTR